jgi:DNA primase
MRSSVHDDEESARGRETGASRNGVCAFRAMLTSAHSLRTPRPVRIDTERLRVCHPIGELVARYGIELRRAGTSLLGRCPFHQDGGRPNFAAYPRSGLWICFRCGLRGDAIAFVQQIEQLSFREAALRLSADALCPQSRLGRTRRAPSNRTPAALGPAEHEVLASAVDLYASSLLRNPAVLDYLYKRGFPRDLLERECVGFAAGGDLVPCLESRHQSIEAALRAGLLRADGSERLAGRIVFPEIRRGQPVWLIGRTLEESRDRPRYLGLPGQKALLGWDRACRDVRVVCLVEGPTDLLALRSWGMPGLAMCGNAISAHAVRDLDPFRRIFLVLDNDTAGREGTARLMQVFGTRAVAVELPASVKDVGELAADATGGMRFAIAIRRALGMPRALAPAGHPAPGKGPSFGQPLRAEGSW